MPVIQSMITSLKQGIDRASDYPFLGVLIRAALKGQKDLAKDMSASIAYFSFLSLFPLILGLVSIGGYFLESTELQKALHDFIVGVLPISADFVTENIASLVRLRGPVGLASLAMLMWSASKIVGSLSRGINNALGLKRPYAFYLSRLRNFLLTVTVSVVVFATTTVAPAIEILSGFDFGFAGERWNAFFELVAGSVTGFAITFTMITIIYTLVPFARLPWNEMLPGILVATIAIEVGKVLFGYYYGSVSSNHLIYGSVSSVIALLLWLYFCGRAVLYGTQVIFVYRQPRRQLILEGDEDPNT
jgi:membrane protein